MKRANACIGPDALRVATVAAALAGAACGPAAAPSTVVVQLGVTADSVTLVDVLAAAPEATPPPGAGTLRYQLTSPGGELLAEGTVPDPRRPAVLWTQSRPAPYLEAGTMFLPLPAVAGELVVGEPAQQSWKIIGRLAFDPHLRRAQGLFDFDIRSEAVRMSGDAPPAQAINIVVLPEGYTASQLSQFHADAERMVPRFYEQADFAAYGRHINVWRVDVASRESGIDDPEGAQYDTAFNTGFGQGSDEDPRRAVYTRGLGGHLKNELFKRKIRRLVGQPVAAFALLVNAPEHGGAAALDLVTVSREAENTGLVLAHELGHSLLKLGDEYEYGECMLEPRGLLDEIEERIWNLVLGERGLPVNVARSAAREDLPWADLVARATPLPTPLGDGRLGAHEGAHYCERGLFRPQASCLMRGDSGRMCPVCRRELDRYVARLTGQPYVAPANAAPRVRITAPRDRGTVELGASDLVQVQVTVEDADGVGRVELLVDGQRVDSAGAVADGGACQLTARVAPGLRRLRVVAYDALGLEGEDEITVTFVAVGAPAPPSDKLAFGAACEIGTQCASGACVPGVRGRFCTKRCADVAECGDGYQCAGNLCLAARSASPSPPPPPQPPGPAGAAGGADPAADGGGCALGARPASGAAAPLLLLLLLLALALRRRRARLNAPRPAADPRAAAAGCR